MLLLPTATPAHSTFRHLRALSSRHQILLSTISASSLLLAYILSPPRGRHPYLLWSTLAIGCGFGKEVLGLWRGKKGEIGLGGMEEWDFGGDKEVETDSDAEELNGEALREGMDAWRGRQLLRTGVWGLGWIMSVIGIWGDGS